MSRFKPEIIDEIQGIDGIIGKVAGINIKSIDFNDELDLNHYIKSIEKLKTDSYERLFIEEFREISKEKIDYLQKSLNIIIDDGEYIRLLHLPLVIKEILKNVKSDLKEKEVLVISDNKEKTKIIIKSIAPDFRFITATGCEHNDHEEIYKYILEETGLSLFYSTNINKILGNYSIIINLIDNVRLDNSKIKKNCFIFDFAKGSSLRNRRRPPVINDFAFDINELGISNNKWIGNKANSRLFYSLCGKENHRVKYLTSVKDYFTIKDYIECFVNIKGKL